MQVRLGEHNVNSDPDCLDGVCAPPVQDINVEEYVCHTGYDSELKQHDICLIRLVKPIQFNSKLVKMGNHHFLKAVEKVYHQPWILFIACLT